MLTLPWSLDGPRAVDGGVFARRRSLAEAHLSAMDGGDQTVELTFAQNSLCPFPVVAGPQKGRPVGGGVARGRGEGRCVYVYVGQAGGQWTFIRLQHLYREGMRNTTPASLTGP